MFVFFFNDTATTEIYTLSLHDALPIYEMHDRHRESRHDRQGEHLVGNGDAHEGDRSEEHTSELQSQSNLVCRLLLEKKKNQIPVRHVASYERSRNRIHIMAYMQIAVCA